jgi:hypothetical protein
MIGERVREALREAIEAMGRNPGLKGAAELAGISHDTARGIVGGRSSRIDLDAAIALGRVVGVDVLALVDRAQASQATIAIAGRVGAGARVPLVDAYEKGDGPQVECPPGLSCHGVVAVEIEGDSMEPVYSSGDLIFYSRHTHDNVPAEAIGHRCVVMDRSGHVWLKQLKQGREPGTFDLHSINAAVATMYGVRLEWAAPVRLHWPAELAVRVA